MPGKKSFQIFVIALISLVLFSLSSEKKENEEELKVSNIFDFNLDKNIDEILAEVSSSTVCISPDIQKPIASAFDQYIESIYKNSELESHNLSFSAFKNGLVGMFNLIRKSEVHNERLISIVDFDLPSTEERMFVIDLKKQKLVKKLLVAHGQKSGDKYATSFSNTPKSHQSSLGFYKTAETYDGKYGYSLRLDGLEKSINCKARERAIVVHGADYVSDQFLRENKRLGRSWGCLALKNEEVGGVIDDIKSGTCIYVHKTLPSYFNATKLLDIISSKRFFENIFAETI